MSPRHKDKNILFYFIKGKSTPSPYYARSTTEQTEPQKKKHILSGLTISFIILIDIIEMNYNIYIIWCVITYTNA